MKKKMTTKVILVLGNIVDGITFEGPFDSEDEAVAYAERVYEDGDPFVPWTTSLMNPPHYPFGGTYES